jgi:hypothetical protein
MFILTTASRIPPDRNLENPGVRNHSKDTDFLTHRDRGQAATSFAQAFSVLRRRRPRIPSSIPTMSISRPAIGVAAAREPVCSPSASERQPLFGIFFKYLQHSR